MLGKGWGRKRVTPFSLFGYLALPMKFHASPMSFKFFNVQCEQTMQSGQTNKQANKQQDTRLGQIVKQINGHIYNCIWQRVVGK